MKKTAISLMLLIGCSFSSHSKTTIEQIDPPNWWVGMHQRDLQLLIYGEQIEKCRPEINYPGVTITSVEPGDHSGYLFIVLDIAPNTMPGQVDIIFRNEKNKIVSKTQYSLLARREGSKERNGFGSEDVIYLIMPDRFANGDLTNDTLKGYKQGVNLKDGYARQGGDIKGIIDRLPYLADLGITAIWPTPLWEDNRDAYSYHHYASSNYYKIDPRFGSNELYQTLSKEAKKHGIKLITDMVINHCGSAHRWAKATPTTNWFNNWDSFTRTNYRLECWADPNGAQIDKKLMVDGWFDTIMPDLNLNEPKLLTYLTQMAKWWVEFGDLDGIRVDTYPYSDIFKVAEWTKSIREEYPNLNIVGECWLNTTQDVAFYQENSPNKIGYNSYLPCVMDFPLQVALSTVPNETDGWDKGTKKYYQLFARDWIYPNIDNIMIMLDNHDTPRYFESVGKSIDKMKMGIGMILTIRGTPQLFYGTEIAMGHDPRSGGMDAYRPNFPGGWPQDSANAFTPEGRTAAQNELFDFTRKLLQWRKKTPTVYNGATKQFLPQGDIYAYARYDNMKTVLVVINNHATQKQTIDMSHFSECYSQCKYGTEMISGAEVSLYDSLTLEPLSIQIIEMNTHVKKR